MRRSIPRLLLRYSGASIIKSNFEPVEGFGSKSGNDLLRKNQNRQEFSLDLPALYDGGPGGQLRIRFGCGLNDHQQVISVNGQESGTVVFSGFQVRDTTIVLSSGDLRSEMNIALEGKASNRDAQTIAFAEITYPRRFDFQNQAAFRFSLPSTNDVRYLEIENFSVGEGEVPVLYDLATGLRYEAIYEDGKVKARLPSMNEARDFWLVNAQRGVKTVVSLEETNFINYDERVGDFVIISHPALFDDGTGNNLVEAYANYRSSAAGGGHRTLVVDVNQLYDQFAYGVARHPISIRNFAHYTKLNWVDLQYFFIIGKGRGYTAVRRAEQVAQNEGVTFFVPTFGYPASDNLMFSNNESSVPIIPIGRIAATNAADIRIYLDKVKALEANVNNPQTIEGRAWMKQVMHLGGGSTASEQKSIRNNLESMGNIIARGGFAADITPYYKSSTDAIEVSVSERIFETINNGVSIITFFGHSSPGTFDFNIDNPDNYNNYGKYPLLMSLGCYSGDMFGSGRSIGERFIFYQDKGAIAFVASGGLGFISSLGNFGRKFYDQSGGPYYGTGIGSILKETLVFYDHLEPISYKTMVQQFNLQGDPAIRLHPSPGSDYVVDARSVKFSPQVVTAQMDSFELSFDIMNLGRFQLDTMDIAIRQELPSGVQIDLGKVRIAGPGHTETIRYSIPGQGSASVGQNKFFIEIDPENEVAELPAPAAESNNSLLRSSGEAGIPLFIIDNTARPVYPSEFGIVSGLPVTLKASTTNALAPEQTYILEIDTTALFNSPLKEQKEITQRGGVIKWQPSLDLQPDEVYYWRVSPDSTETSIGYAWEGSSFTYIPGSPDGWSQGDYWQWLEGGEGDIKMNEDRNFDFSFSPLDMTIKNSLSTNLDPPAFFYNNSSPARSVRPWTYLDGGVAVMVGYPRKGSFWANDGRQFGSIDARGRAVFSFPTTTHEERKLLIDFLTEIIPEKYYVYVFTVLKNEISDFRPEEWAADSLIYGTNIINVLKSEGALDIDQITELGSVPYVFMYQKGEMALAEKIGLNKSDVISVTSVLPQYKTEGQYVSPTIGPGRNWESLDFQLRSNEVSSFDSISINIFGLRKSGEKVLVAQNITSDTSLSFIKASEFPFLKLEYFAKNDDRNRPPQISKWKVSYESYSELALNPNSRYLFYKDTIQRGEQLSLEVAIENISNYSIDSLKTTYILRSPDNREQVFDQEVGALEVYDTLHSNFALDTKELLTGNYQLQLEIKSENHSFEQFLFNNFLHIPFYVQEDRRNPLLDVTFDGYHIMDGDLVSYRPTIVVAVEDDNRALLIRDSLKFEIELIFPDGSIRNYYEYSSEVDIEAENSSNRNRILINFNPNLEQEGNYLMRVKVWDFVGNTSSEIPYEISFEVITKNSISRFVNYPNPFSEATQFVYTLTGEEPAFFKIQIMTVSGQIVREIFKEELGDLIPGTHRTEFTWDGTDDYGDKLANGIYLYRIIAKDFNGNDYELYDNQVEQFFQKGIGKMVILR